MNCQYLMNIFYLKNGFFCPKSVVIFVSKLSYISLYMKKSIALENKNIL